jgi:transcriptional regulator with XRE-family HTH domain
MQDTKEDSGQKELDPRIKKMAAKLRELRIEKGYSNHEFFAWDNEINRVQYWNIEKGSNITIKTLLKILDIHGISLSEFFKEM